MYELTQGLGYTPRTCTWELTLKCNLNCGHCGSKAGKPRKDEMDRETSLRVIRELGALGCRKVTLSGGEPTMSPHWQAIASEGNSAGVRVNMITNAVGWTRDKVREAKDAGLTAIGASLDGLEDAHNGLRGKKGLFGNVMGLMDHCSAVGMPMGIVTTIWKGNAHDLDAMAELLYGKVYAWQVQLGEAMGNFSAHPDQAIEPEDLLHIVPTLAGIVEEGRTPIRVAHNVGYFGPYEKTLRSHPSSPATHWVGCFAGCRHMGIEANGGVKGCLSLQATSATEGNLWHESLQDIWTRPGTFAYNRAFSVDDLSGFCRTCTHARICRGGCLSMRTCEGGGENPYCYHRVATLAERARSPRRYIPMVVAPAAVMAMFGFGCSSSSPVQDADIPGEDAYGVPDAEMDADPDNVTPDADPDVVYADVYGFPDTDPDNADVDIYGIPDADPDNADVDIYGIPDVGPVYGFPDADVETGDVYGIPDADADTDGDADIPSGDLYGMA